MRQSECGKEADSLHIIISRFLFIGGVMSRKLGRIMSNSRMVSFVAFLAATLAWVLNMPALFTVSLLALAASAVLYLSDKYKESKKKRASQ